MVLMTISQNSQESKRQRRMGVEPTRDRAERPPSRFEDGETHRGPYTSMFKFTGRIVPFMPVLVKRHHAMPRDFTCPTDLEVPRHGRVPAMLLFALRSAESM